VLTFNLGVTSRSAQPTHPCHILSRSYWTHPTSSMT